MIKRRKSIIVTEKVFVDLNNSNTSENLRKANLGNILTVLGMVVMILFACSFNGQSQDHVFSVWWARIVMLITFPPMIFFGFATFVKYSGRLCIKCQKSFHDGDRVVELF